MSLPWVRLDANIATHDKVLALLAQRDGYRAFTLYVCALGWAGGHGTDGFVPRYVIPHLHGTERHAQSLVESRLWEYAEGGYAIRNWTERQQTAAVSRAKSDAQRRGARRTNCVRYHGKDCGCWQHDDGSPAPVVDLGKRRSSDR